MFTDFYLQTALVGYEVRAAAKFTNLPLQIPTVGTKFTVLSLQIYPCKEDRKKNHLLLLLFLVILVFRS